MMGSMLSASSLVIGSCVEGPVVQFDLGIPELHVEAVLLALLDGGDAGLLRAHEVVGEDLGHDVRAVLRRRPRQVVGDQVLPSLDVSFLKEEVHAALLQPVQRLGVHWLGDGERLVVRVEVELLALEVDLEVVHAVHGRGELQQEC